MINLTKNEMEVMDALWSAGHPMGRHNLLDTDHKWKASSVHILLNGLLAKGAIREVGIEKRVKTYGRLFVPTMTREAYWVQQAYNSGTEPDPAALIAQILWMHCGDPKKVDKMLGAARAEWKKTYDVI